MGDKKLQNDSHKGSAFHSKMSPLAFATINIAALAGKEKLHTRKSIGRDKSFGRLQNTDHFFVWSSQVPEKTIVVAGQKTKIIISSIT
jgi:hypothetical protein